jgi:UDP-N-acetylmuramoyl-tripeptide--D-alanyl-D-alanine ligase
MREEHLLRLKLAYTRARRDRMRDLRVIGITGSSAKSTTTAILAHILSQNARVASNRLDNSLTAVARTLRKAPRGTQFAVLEIAAGDTPKIERVAALVRPDVAIVTMIEIEHYSTFRTKEAIAEEKGHLVAAVPATGLALLNAEDPYVMGMAQRTKARIVTFGRLEDADYVASEIAFRMPGGLRFRIVGRGHDLTVTANLFGIHFYLPVLAAVSCALELGIDAATILQAVASFEGYSNRCGVAKIEGGPTFVLDTAKGPYHSIRLPIDALAAVEAPRKTIVIGQISDYKGKPQPVYSAAAKHAAQVADRVYLAGPNAHKAKLPEQTGKVEFARFHEVGELAAHLKKTAIPGEVILLKSSQNIHLERAFLAFRSEIRCMAVDCGLMSGCLGCGLYEVPHHEHPRGETRRRKRVAAALKADAAKAAAS